MDHRRQALFGMIQCGQKPVHAIQRQVDDLGVE
jgi:hypothetical protein